MPPSTDFQLRKPVTQFGGHIFSAVPPIFKFWGTLISYIDESGTYFKVQIPVSVKQSNGEKSKRGRYI